MRVPLLRISILVNFIFISFFQLLGQSSGWQAVEEGQIIKAKEIFGNVLLENENDEDALCGMIFISEVLQDHLNYKKYINQLIRSTWSNEYFALFPHLFEGQPTELFSKKLNPSLFVQPKLTQADSFFYNRNFGKGTLAIKSVAQDLNWSVIGPFDNVAGSGHVDKQALEIESFKPDRIYFNENNLPLKWIQRYHGKATGEVMFNENLSYSRDGTYYANTFLSLEKQGKIQLRITRNTPLKIWVDDDLVLDKKNNLKYSWDGEILEIQLAKGMHRILVKASTYIEEASKSELHLGFNDQYDEEKLESNLMDDFSGLHFNNRNYKTQGNEIAKFAIRLTDLNGAILTNVNTDFFGKNKTRSYQPNLIEKRWVSIFKNKIKLNPDDLKNYYLLAKMFLFNGQREEGEEWFFSKIKNHEKSFYFKFLFAKILAANNKGELSEKLLSDIKFAETPVVANLASQLRKMDMKKEVANYHSKVRQILQVSPTHKEALVAYLDWMTNNGEEENKKEFIRSFLTNFPNSDYRDLFLKFLTTSQNGIGDSDFHSVNLVEKDGLEAIERMKRVFDPFDYLNAIAYFKKKKNPRRVIKLYDDLIGRFPHRIYYLKEKANYLLEKEKVEEAILVYENALKINPYRARILEKIGGIYFEKNEKKMALKYYEAANGIDRATKKSKFTLNRIQRKIQSIAPVKSAKNIFQHFSKNEIQKDLAWQNQYKKNESLILMYNIQAELDKNNRLNYRQNLWIKILNEGGANYWTEADFTFLGEIGLVKVIKEDGSEVTPSRNYNLVVFQNLEPGDLIQIEGFSSGNMTREIPNEMFHIAWLSMEVPIYRSVFEMVLPKGKQLNYVCNKIDCNAVIRETIHSQIFKWENYYTPKNEHEEAVLDDKDKFAWVMMSTQNDWSKVVKWYDRITYRRLEANYDVINQLKKIVHDGMTETEKVNAVYSFLTKGITYSHVSFLNSNYVPKKPSHTISGGIGDCKDVASLMISMLRELNIEANYVLVRTKNYTQKEPTPSVLAFDHVVVGYRLADGILRFADLTTDYFSGKVLPEFDNNQWALLIKPRETQLFRLPNDQLNPHKNLLKIETFAQISKGRNLELNVKMDAIGVVAGTWRESLNNKTTKKDHLEFLTESFASADFDHLKIGNFSFQNLKDLDLNLTSEINLKAFHHLEKVSDFQILQIPILHPITTRTAMFGDTRHNNLALDELFNLAPCEQIINLEIPTGYELLEIPRDFILENDFGLYELTFNRKKEGIQIKRKLIFKKHFINSEDYSRFKKFYLKLLDGDRTKLAIRKRVKLVKN